MIQVEADDFQEEEEMVSFVEGQGPGIGKGKEVLFQATVSTL
jgi:hypothetical protein